MHTILNAHRSTGATPTRTTEGLPPLRSSQGWEPRTYISLLEIILAFAISSILCAAQNSLQYQHSFHVSREEPVKLDVEIDRADLQILYERDGEVSIYGTAAAPGDAKLEENYFASALSIQQIGNEITIRERPGLSQSGETPKLRFRINVPYRTEVHTSLHQGTQTLRGLLGPVDARSHKGDIHASYISRAVHTEVDNGSVDLELIGETALAKVGVGNILGQRLDKGIQAETQDGDITLVFVGSSLATVAGGTGRIDVRGARGKLTLSTDAGDLRVQAVPHNDWKLQSRLGTIRLNLPEELSADLQASTDSGELQVERDDISKDEKRSNSIARQIGSGGKLIAAHTEKGRIVIQ
jgi:hypothetical protein